MPGTAAAADVADVRDGWRSDASNPQLRFHVAVFGTLGLCAVLYTFTGAFGYLACGDSIKGDVLLNFPVSDPVAAVARALMAVHVILALPVVVLPCRKAIFMLAFFIASNARKKGGWCGRLCAGTSSPRATRDGAAGAGAAREATHESRAQSIDGEDAIEHGSSPPGVPAAVFFPGGATDPHADVLAAYRQLEHETNLVCGMGCSPKHLFWNLLLVLGPALIAVVVPQVQV